jgi:hypothetical protein
MGIVNGPKGLRVKPLFREEAVDVRKPICVRFIYE